MPPAVAKDLVPEGLELDLYDGKAYVSLLPLRMANVRLRDLPGIPHLTDFPELNLRTYVRHQGEPGVYFMSLDAPSGLAVWIGKHVFHVRYDHADMSMEMDRAARSPSTAIATTATPRSRRVVPGPGRERGARGGLDRDVPLRALRHVRRPR